ncbi:MAG: tyrosine-type recombinase/integrase, partial [Gemmatimonadales bacterium]
LTLEQLWTLYQQEAPAYSGNTKRTQDQKQSAAKRLMAVFSTSKKVEHLTANDVARYVSMRRSGAGWPDGRVRGPVRATAVRHDLALLREMILWASRERRPEGGWLLRENPLRGLKLPREEDPLRPIATYDRFLKVREAAQKLAATAPQARGREQWLRFELALVLAEATGRRIGAIRGLRWSNIQYDLPTIRWRAEFDKRSREGVIPITQALADEIRGFQLRLKAVGDGWLFPQKRRDEPWPREVFGQLLVRVEEAAGVPKLKGGRWHAYRRKWATERKKLSVVDVMAAGGWKDLQTLLTCYQHSDEETMLEVMASPVKLRDRRASSSR